MHTMRCLTAFVLTSTLLACAAPAPDTEEPAASVADEAAPTAVADGAPAEEMTPGERANADFEDKATGADLLAALAAGGHVVYFRHAQTERDYADQADPNMSLDDCESQRKLSQAGIQDAEAIGAAWSAKGIPLGQVITSEYCRAWKTAELAFGRYAKDPRLNFLPFETYTDEQVEQMRNNLLPLLTTVPKDGTNTVIVGHDDLFEAATGIYPEPQGIAYVLTPDGEGGFTLVANLRPAEWADL